VLPAWDERRPELEFCEFVASLMQMVQPAVVVETGTGDGLVARRILEHVGTGQRLLSFDKDTPDEDDFSAAAMSVMGSASDNLLDEVRAWWRAAPAGAIVIIHGVGMDHPLAPLMGELGIPGAFLNNPSGAFLGVKPEPPPAPHRPAA
jgi:hypothetical protein